MSQGLPFDGELPAVDRANPASMRMRDRLVETLRTHGFDSMEAYRQHLDRNAGSERYPHSADSVARAAGINLHALRRALAEYPESGPITHRKQAGSTSTAARDALARELLDRGFDSFQSWQDHVDRNATVEIRTPRFVELSDDLLTLLGAFVSDGWIRRDSERVVGFAERRSELDGMIPLLVKRVWGIDVTRTDHRTKDLTQTFVRSVAVWSLFHHFVPRYEFTANTKHLPDWCGDLSRAQKMVLLEGLWWGDGSRSAERATYTTTSAALMAQVRDLLWAVGAPAGRPARRAHRRPSSVREHLAQLVDSDHAALLAAEGTVRMGR